MKKTILIIALGFGVATALAGCDTKESEAAGQVTQMQQCEYYGKYAEAYSSLGFDEAQKLFWKTFPKKMGRMRQANGLLRAGAWWARRAYP